MKKLNKPVKVALIIIFVIIVILLAIYINHIIRLKMESQLFKPLGQIVEVDGNKMSVYIEGDGEKTLVFLSGGGTCSPILDFKSLYSRLSGEYKIAVIEKFGYGFSDVVDKERSLDSILSDTRAALTAAGVDAPYVLCPHSMSGLEAIYWANEYPDEVSAIIGLDMAVPAYYDEMKINIPLMRMAQFAAQIGITRIIPDIAESDAIKNGTLTDGEKAAYRAVFYRRTATNTMINECAYVKANAEIVKESGVPNVPMLLFISDGSGGTGFDEDSWRSIPKEYIKDKENAQYIELDCPHYVHDYEYELISDKITDFLEDK